MEHPDYLVIGGGIIGLTIARQLRRSFPGATVSLLEKEEECGLHASGRNSGVVHAGFYYSPDSMKAKLTWRGNRLLRSYCEERQIPRNQCGKLVVARNRAEHAALDELLRRGRANGIPLQAISEQDARAIEPRVKTSERALFSPETWTVDPLLVMRHIRDDAMADGVQLERGVRFLRRQGSQIVTSEGIGSAGYLINAAGLYADRIARQYGFGTRYRVLPFRGLYLYSSEPPGSIRTNIYPVPDLQYPFLGVHFTVLADGRTKIGPTATPALWREQYGGFRNFSGRDLLEIGRRGLGLLAGSDQSFRSLVVRELSQLSRRRIAARAGELVHGVRESNYRTWGKPGIRAQLVDVSKGKLEMDFVVEGDARSMHVLNAVSPAFTCALPFAELVCERIGQLLK
jgi:L-2-hydroxyglutarate oxidase LhgO